MTDPNRPVPRPDACDPTVDVHPCRTCGRDVPETADTFPFCSDRCRDVDLGNWFNGSYKISREVKDSDIETMD